MPGGRTKVTYNNPLLAYTFQDKSKLPVGGPGQWRRYPTTARHPDNVGDPSNPDALERYVETTSFAVAAYTSFH